MSIATLVIGESGTGKTASLRNLNPTHTLLIQTIRKPLPFRAAGWGYFDREKNPKGNVFVADRSHDIVALMRRTSRSIVVIDDWVYSLTTEYMSRSAERGFEKFAELGRHAWDVLTAATSLAPTARVYVLSHTHTDDFGRVRPRTIGKLLDEKVVVEGMFSIVLRTMVEDNRFYLSTRNSGSDPVKAPIGMFDEPMIDNDLALVDERVRAYYDIPERQHEVA